ncbi:AsmA family protein [Chitinimonas sp. PSY-7]|uniref:AsmA family protein n=1 Tax=Chitinimonas sp. PSY-7 TaxID=3459088 RepID=UPI00403FFEB2
MTDTYRYSSALRWLVGIVGVGVLLVLAVYFFPWNVLRPYVVSQLERATGRHVEINGDLEVKLGLRPRIVLNDLVLGNASWSETSVMAQAQQFSMVLSLPALFRYRIDLPEMTLTGAEVLLEQHPDHGGNWVLAGETSEEKSDWDLKIGQLQLQRTQVRYLEKSAGTDLVARVASTSVTETSSTPLVATLNGHYRKLSTNIDLNGGGLLSLRDRQLPYPLKAQGRMGNTAFNASGTVTDPMLLTGLAVDFVLSGDSMAELYTILNLPLPPTPRYRVAGKLMRTGSVWSLNSFTGSVGRSDLAGDFSVDKGPQRQYINADLQSRRLDLKDLAGFVGELDQKGDAAPQPPGKLLPHSPFHLEKLRAADMDVRFRGHQIITPKWPVDNMQCLR